MSTLKSSWTSPSNIALVKYWGKIPVQIPANPSISFTLTHSITLLQIELQDSRDGKLDLDFYFEDVLNEKFKTKIEKFLLTQIERFPWLTTFKLIIHSTNTFPHSSGIASSASSMSALNMCLMDLDEKISGHKKLPVDFLNEASDLSRQASGSAGRSVFPFMATWGEIDSIPESSNRFARAVDKNSIAEIFHDYKDSIIIVDAGEKSVSSRAGHSLMENHPFNEERYKRARTNMNKLLVAMKSGDMPTFIEVVEEEALMLHALMMTSTPSYILLKPESLMLIEKIREYRNKTGIPVCFTIDAGPNIHLLYPAQNKSEVEAWIKSEFSKFTVIHDEVGAGPVNKDSMKDFI